LARYFAFRPAFTLRGRKFLGLRGFTGKPTHPPLTDIPIGAYMLAAAADLISSLWSDASWSQDLYHAAGWAMMGGVVVSLGAALTGYMDWLKSVPKATQARRTVNAHAWTMLTVTAIVLIDIAVRLGSWDDGSTPIAVLVLTLVVAGLTVVGATIGGTLVFDYGFNVATAGDSPVWHKSERNLLPGEKPPPADQAP
jgi:uncharacterized membrane protein